MTNVDGRKLAPAIALGAGLLLLGEESGSGVLKVAGALILILALTHGGKCHDCETKSTATVEGPMTMSKPHFGSKKNMSPKREFVVRRVESYQGPPEQGAIGLPSGERKGVTPSFSLLTRGDGLRKIPQAGALQFGSQPMGAQKRLVRA